MLYMYEHAGLGLGAETEVIPRIVGTRVRLDACARRPVSAKFHLKFRRQVPKP